MSIVSSNADYVYDELLVTQIKLGDRRAGELLVARWQPRLFRTARRLLRDQEAARDAVQETWVGIFAGVGRLRDVAHFPAWAFGILHRKCVDRVRLEQRRRASGEAEPDSLVEPAAAEDAVAIAQALAALSLDHRAAAILFFAEGLTLAEVAAATSVPLGTAKSRIFHARRQLAAAFSGDIE